MKKKLDVSKTILINDKLARQIQRTADQYKLSFSRIIRECVEKELPRLKQRYKKRKKRGTKILKK